MPRTSTRALPAVSAALAAAACLFAFLGLSTSGYWTDELFALFVVDHAGGPGEVLRRALTDTHPPGYYLVLYGWTRLFGLSEPAARSLSGILAVSAAGIFFFGLRGVFSPAARAFGLAIGLNSVFWFQQAQNTRNYPLAVAAAASLLALAVGARAAVREGRRVPARLCAGLVAAGTVASAAHAYGFLLTGLVFLALVVSAPSLRLRATLVVAGGVIATLYLAYARVLMSTTEQDLHHMWFKASPLFFFDQVTVAWRIVWGFSGLAALVVLGALGWRRRGAGDAHAPDAAWTAGLAAFVHLGMIGLGIVVSVALAPSMSALNLAVASPMLWALAAFAWDRAIPAGAAPRPLLAGFLLLVLAIHTAILAGRFLPMREAWRGSARYVQGLAACRGQPIPVVLPTRFGPPTPFFRRLAEQSFYGRYFADRTRLTAYLPAELTAGPRAAELAPVFAERARDPAACPVLAWGVHDLEQADADAIAARLQATPALGGKRVTVRAFRSWGYVEAGYDQTPTAFVFEVAR